MTLVALVFAYSLLTTLQKIQTSSKAIEVLDQEIAKISSDVSGLRKNVAQSQTSLTQEKIIRDQLLLQKPGETILQISALPEEEKIVVSQNSVSPSQAWWNLFWE
jgi:hypothetical protein